MTFSMADLYCVVAFALFVVMGLIERSRAMRRWFFLMAAIMLVVFFLPNPEAK